MTRFYLYMEKIKSFILESKGVISEPTAHLSQNKWLLHTKNTIHGCFLELIAWTISFHAY
jgi:hypothetical protein